MSKQADTKIYLGSCLLSALGSASVKQDDLRCQCPWRHGLPLLTLLRNSASIIVVLGYHI
eukprot:717694-Pelagomonas_calceolata.AAC.1